MAKRGQESCGFVVVVGSEEGMVFDCFRMALRKVLRRLVG